MFYGHALYAETARAKDVRLYRQDRMADREMEKLEEHNRRDNKALNGMSACQGLLEFSRGVCNMLCYLFVAAKAALGAFAVGSVVQYVGALMQLVKSVGDLLFTVSENKIYTAHLEKLFDYLDLPNRKQQGTIPVNREDGGEYTIEFRNVSFRYPGGDHDVLKNISTTLHAGKKLALVGANGAGKTTFVKLLCRLYDPTEGQILLNGTDIREYDYTGYLKLFSFVFQDFQLFAFPLGENVAAGEHYDSAKAEECLEKAGFGERLRTMPEGLQTHLYRELSEKGVEISGGEAQKIALARALYRESPIIVLDEPTAALDPVAEAQVYASFSSMVGDRTAVYISHRLSSCRFCDEITVFDQGRIVQQGTHEELMQDQKGKYSELWNAQAQYYVQEPSSGEYGTGTDPDP
jgi:ATP-binding cassette subfamily B protein